MRLAPCRRVLKLRPVGAARLGFNLLHARALHVGSVGLHDFILPRSVAGCARCLQFVCDDLKARHLIAFDLPERLPQRLAVPAAHTIQVLRHLLRPRRVAHLLQGFCIQAHAQISRCRVQVLAVLVDVFRLKHRLDLGQTRHLIAIVHPRRKQLGILPAPFCPHGVQRRTALVDQLETAHKALPVPAIAARDVRSFLLLLIGQRDRRLAHAPAQILVLIAQRVVQPAALLNDALGHVHSRVQRVAARAVFGQFAHQIGNVRPHGIRVYGRSVLAYDLTGAPVRPLAHLVSHVHRFMSGLLLRFRLPGHAAVARAQRLIHVNLVRALVLQAEAHTVARVICLRAIIPISGFNRLRFALVLRLIGVFFAGFGNFLLIFLIFPLDSAREVGYNISRRAIIARLVGELDPEDTSNVIASFFVCI